jgi:hypothetical protein
VTTQKCERVNRPNDHNALYSLGIANGGQIVPKMITPLFYANVSFSDHAARCRADARKEGQAS